MKNFLQKYREAIALMIWVIAILALIRFMIVPLLGKITEVNDQIQEESLKQEITQKNIKDLPRVQQQYEQLQKNGNLVDVLLSKNSAIDLIKRLEKNADDSGIKIAITVQDKPVQKTPTSSKNKNSTTTSNTNASTNNPTAAANDNALVNDLPGDNYLELKLTLSGKYEAIMKFIDTMEHFEYYSDIISLDIKKDDISNDRSVTQSVQVGNGDPFGTKSAVGQSTNDKDNNQNPNNNDLDAIIDVVFYTNKD